MKTERLKEGWVNFTRVHCKDGYIDRFIGDCVDDPNSKDRRDIQLNAISEYFRVETLWVHRNDFHRNFFYNILDLSEEFTAIEIWEAYKIESND